MTRRKGPQSALTSPRWAGRKQWALNKDEQSLLASTGVLGREMEWSASQMRALRRPEPDGVPIEQRKTMALAVYVTEVDGTLELALREFLPDDLWNLLRALELAQTGVTRGRRNALRDGEAEYRSHADQLVVAWRDCRRLRLRLQSIAAARGLRGWDDPDAPRYLQSAPLETEHRLAIATVENELLQHAAYRVMLWLDARVRTARVDRHGHLVRVRRTIVALLSSSGLGYQRVAALITAPYWRVAPCPSLAKRGRDRIALALKADLRRGRRAAPARSAPIEI